MKIYKRFLIIHARKAFPWRISHENIHPINIGEKYAITHHGIIKNNYFPKVNNPKLEKIEENTDLDTRKYFYFIIDKLKDGLNLKETLEFVFKNIVIGIGVNVFSYNSSEYNIITHHNTSFYNRHHTLFFSNNNDNFLVSTTSLIPNRKKYLIMPLFKLI